MASIAKDAAGKVDVAAQFGNVKDRLQNPLRTTISSVTCGDLMIRFESIEWLNKEDPTKYDAPIPSFVARVGSYRDSKGYMQDIQLSSDPIDILNMANVLEGVAKFIKETGVDVSKAGFFKNDIGTAYEKFAPNGKK